MNEQSDEIKKRKKEHLELCLTDDVAFKKKSTGFEYYDFIHDAATEIELEKISFETKFFNHKISYPFLISCMTGGVEEADNINLKLASAANELNVPLGLGSQRYALNNDSYVNNFKEIRKKAGNIPILSNLGAAQIAALKDISPIKKIIEQSEADVLVVHCNPLQELIQKEGETNFSGLLKAINKLSKELSVPIIIKEVGSGISKKAAKKFLNEGAAGIDVAGAGGTSWSGIESIRNKNQIEEYLWDWGLPTSYCIKKVFLLKKKYDFLLIGSGGINSSYDAAKALALGADMVASARTILKKLESSNVLGVVQLVINWFNDIKNIMYLTGSKNLSKFKKDKIILKQNFYI